MRRVHLLVFGFCLFFAFEQTAHAEEELTIAAAAGYKRLIEELCTTCTAGSGVKVHRIFGNMGQITAQARQSDAIDLLIGDRGLLDAAGLAFDGEYPIGRGRLVAAVARGVTINRLEQLADPGIGRIAIADPRKTMYGLAADEYLTRAGIRDEVQRRLLIVGTLPQISAYVIRGEVDVGLINMTEALAITEKVARILPVDETLYSPILIVVRRLRNGRNDAAALKFVRFVETPAARAIIQAHGLQ